jgi:hypothetical protein
MPLNKKGKKIMEKMKKNTERKKVNPCFMQWRIQEN